MTEADPFAFLGYRSVRVKNIPKSSHKDFALLLAKKCGPIDKWRHDEDDLHVVFMHKDSATTAVALNGLRFDQQVAYIWKADEDAPKALMLLEGPKEKTDEQAIKENRERIKGLLEQLSADLDQRRFGNKDAGAEGSSSTTASVKMNMTEEEREIFLNEHAVRQAKALLVLGMYHEELQRTELQRLRDQIEVKKKALEAARAAGGIAMQE
jgi:hypothetical protein